MTKTQSRSYLIRAFRRVWFWSDKRKDCLKESFNLQTKKFHCTKCWKGFSNYKKLVVDHIQPVIDPERGFVDWNNFDERLNCSVEGLQALCRPCHKAKSNEENNKRRKLTMMSEESSVPVNIPVSFDSSIKKKRGRKAGYKMSEEHKRKIQEGRQRKKALRDSGHTLTTCS